MRAVVPLVVGLIVAASPATVADGPRLGAYNTRATHEITGEIGGAFVAVVVRDLPACDPRGDGPVGEMAGGYVQFAVNDSQVFGPGTPEITGASVHRAGPDSFVALVPAPHEGYARFRMRCRAADGGWNQLLDDRWLYVGHRNVAPLQAQLMSDRGQLRVIDLNLFGQRGELDLASVRASVDGVATTVGAGAATPGEPTLNPPKNDSYVVDLPPGLAAGLHELRLATATDEIVVPFIHIGETSAPTPAPTTGRPASLATTGVSPGAPPVASAGGGSTAGKMAVSLVAALVALAAGGFLLVRRRRSRA